MELPFNVEDVEAIGAAGRWYQLNPELSKYVAHG
jgi:hypothetical protein